MHFYYFDESGDTGANLRDADQPVFVFGGISLRDEAWNRTQSEYLEIIRNYLGGEMPVGFELHASDLLSPSGGGLFRGHDIGRRGELARAVLRLLHERKHGTHYYAIDKARLEQASVHPEVSYDPKVPYLLAFDYAVTLVNWHAKEKLGASARALIIVDEKSQHAAAIDSITRERRFSGSAAHRAKWITEISYPVDSRRNIMVQASDLVALCARRFLEIENGYRPTWRDEARNFYAGAYDLIDQRLIRKELVDREGRGMDQLNSLLRHVQCVPIGQWRRRYDLGAA